MYSRHKVPQHENAETDLLLQLFPSFLGSFPPSACALRCPLSHLSGCPFGDSAGFYSSARVPPHFASLRCNTLASFWPRRVRLPAHAGNGAVTSLTPASTAGQALYQYVFLSLNPPVRGANAGVLLVVFSWSPCGGGGGGGRRVPGVPVVVVDALTLVLYCLVPDLHRQMLQESQQ